MSNKRRKKHRLFWHFIRFQLFLMLLVAGAVGYYYGSGYAQEVKALRAMGESYARMSTVDTFRQSETSIIYDDNGGIISKMKSEKDTYYLEYDSIPTNVIAAMVSIEDKKFYQHNGIDLKAIVRAGLSFIKNKKITQGASTITQQLARTTFLTQKKTWQRKVEEIYLALALEKKYSKSQIMEFYLNNIYFGNGYYGIQAASKGYFNMDVQSLSLSQIAFLCAIPNNPTIYDPKIHMDKTIQRRDRILQNMYEDGKITVSALNLAKIEKIELTSPTKVEKNDYVQTFAGYCTVRALMKHQGFEFRNNFESDQDKADYNLEYDEMYAECQSQLFSGGYRVYTSLNLDIQDKLQVAIDSNLVEYTSVNEEGVYELQSAGVCIDNRTGYVKAAVGGRKQDFAGYTLNRAYQSFRQPGSSIKPLVVYTPAFDVGYTPETLVEDVPIEDGPSNAGGAYSGTVPLRFAVEHSRNVVAWNILGELTPEKGLEYLRAIGFSKLDKEDNRQTTALGGLTNGASPLEMAAGYATIENDGSYREPTCIMRITDSNGNEVYSSAQAGVPVYRPESARMMTDVLKGVLVSGTGAGLGLENMPAAAKTGTTNDNKDGWFVGYTGYYTTSIWVGYDMPRELPGLSGSSYPGAIWHQFMSTIHEGLEPKEFMTYEHVEEEQPVVEEEQPVDIPQEPEMEQSQEQDGLSEEQQQEEAPADVPQEPLEQPQPQEQPLEEGPQEEAPADVPQEPLEQPQPQEQPSEEQPQEDKSPQEDERPNADDSSEEEDDVEFTTG